VEGWENAVSLFSVSGAEDLQNCSVLLS